MKSGVLLVLALWLASGASGAQDLPKGAIAGTVVNEVTGEPVRRAGVMLSGSARNKPIQRMLVQTQAEGQFRFEGLEAGRYQVTAQKSGYVGGLRWNTTESEIVLVAGEQKTGITVKMTPQSIISGRVFDDEGEPAQGARVQLLQRRKVRGKLVWQPGESVTTNDRGEYRIANLTAGEFVVFATHTDVLSNMAAMIPNARPTVFATTYYPNAADVNAAQAIAVQKGGESAGIDLRLRRDASYRVRVRVEGPTAETQQGVSVQLVPQDGSLGRSSASNYYRPIEPGLYELGGVRPGSWLVQAQVSQPSGTPLIGFTPIEVTNADLNDVVVRLGVGSQITGTLVLEGTSPTKMSWKNHVVQLTAADGQSTRYFMGGRPTMTDDGAFTVPQNGYGKFLIQVRGPLQKKMYLASIKIGSEEFLGKEIDLTNGSPGAVKIIYRTDAATVKGKLEGEVGASSDKPGMAVLMPMEPHLRRMEFMMTAPIMPGGTFQFGTVRPGEYLVCHMLADYQTLVEEGEPPKESMEAAVRLKVDPDGTHTVQLKAMKAVPQP